MLEHWFWVPEVLRAVCCHYSYMSPAHAEAWEAGERHAKGVEHGPVQRPPREIPEALLRAVVRSRFVDAELAELRQLHFAVFDMVVHSPKDREEVLGMDFAALYNRLRTEILLIPGPEGEKEEGKEDGEMMNWRWGMGHARFGHMFGYAGAYDAGYYGYLL